MIIGTLAQKQNGKDTVADHLVAKHGFQKRWFAYPVKEAARVMFDFNDEQLYGNLKEVVDPRWNVSPRQILEVLGTQLSQYDLPRYLPAMKEKIADEGRAIWVYRLKLELGRMLQEGKDIVVADVRFHHEVKAIQEMGGVVIRVIRPGYVDTETQIASEREILTAKYDHLIMNDDTLETLYGRVDGLINEYRSN